MATTPRPTASGRARPHRTARRTQAERSQATRTQLVDATIGLLRSRSFHGTTVFEVAKAAGLTPGALQHHFGSKAELMAEVIDTIVRSSGPEGVAWPAPTGPLDERVRALLLALWQRVYEPPRFLAAWSVYFGAAAEHELQGHIAARRATLTEALHARFVEVLPELAGRPDSRAVVALVLSSLRGMAIVRLFGDQAVACAEQLQVLAGLLAAHATRPPVPPAAAPAPSPRSARQPRSRAR